MRLVDQIRKLLGGSGNGGSAPDVGGESAACKPISCMEALSKVHEYLDGELDGVSQEEVAKHFEICGQCYPHLRLEERFREVMRKVGAKEEAPENLKVQVLELLAAESKEGG
jgi:mycothiol system anti-sigma-R factor